MSYELILNAPNLNLSYEQRKEIKKELDKLDSNLFESMRKYYRMVAVPNKDGFKVIDLGVPTYGDTKSLTDEVYDKLVGDEEILEKVAPNVLKIKYLKNNDFVSTAAIYQSTFSTPGEFRLSRRTVLENAIVQGVQLGLFGLGTLADDKPVCNHFKESTIVYFDANEILIKDSICAEQKKKPEVPTNRRNLHNINALNRQLRRNQRTT